MRGLIAKGMALPIPGKAMVGMVLAGGIYGVFALLGMNQLGFMLGIAMAVVTFVLALFAFGMEKRDKKKAAAVEANIADSAASTPTGVNKVADRAKLDDLRRQFETGVQTFRDYGKNLYEMPWYVVVGEPGSGKTEAIRHSGIGFPPGLQDQLQGTGGTVNMNWWFTDQAVVLDTAGRMLFEDVAPGENNEWREFLKLLRASRANCPINGMLLVIPADTLITDKPDEIEKKAGKIAQQFDQIQRSLGVRFPVFVLITKSDLINGFREFFDDITDPRLTAQMLGWSNPSDLDDPFKPDRVEEHLDSVRDHLLQRRFALLQDPIHSEDPKGRRIDQVDALYKFPEAITELSPRLRRYLEMIFVAGEWSQKPLFLRGIYFTSSMRDGDALDADLAEVLGVGVGALSEGKLWERERSYFLRDVFLDKVFKERGLVTRAANAGQVKRKRAMVLAGAALVASLLLAAMIWYSYSQTKARIQNPRDFWVEVRGAVEDVASEADGDSDLTPAGAIRQYLSPLTVRSSDPRERDLIVAQPLESGNAAVRMDGAKLTYLEVFERAKQYYEENSSSSGLFSLVAALPGGGKDIFKRQLPTQRLLFEQLVLARAAELARQDILEDGRNRAVPIGWGAADLGPKALGSMISLEVASVMGDGAPMDGQAFEDLVGFAIAAEGEGSVSVDEMAELRAYMEWLYSDGSGWPPTTLGVATENAVNGVSRGIDSFNQRWRDPRGEGTLFGYLRSLSESAIGLEAAEERLADVSRRLGLATDLGGYQALRTEWENEYAGYQSAFAAFDGAFVQISDEFNGDQFRNSNIAEEARLAVWASAKTAYDDLIDRFGDETARLGLDEEKDGEARLIAWREALVDAKNAAEQAYRDKAEQLVSSILSSVVPRHLAMRGGSRLFAVRNSLYSGALGAIGREIPTGESLKDVMESVDRAALDEIRQAAPEANGVAGTAAETVYRAAARQARYEAMNAEIVRLQDWELLLTQGSVPSLPVIPLTRLDTLTYEKKYSPANNLGLRASFRTLRGLAEKTEDGLPYVLDGEAIKSSIASIEMGLQPHIDDYERFWSERVPGALVVRGGADQTWPEMRSTLLTSQRTFEAFEELREMMAEALGDPAEAQTSRIQELAEAVLEEDDDDDLRAKIQNGLVASWGGLSGGPAEAGETLRRSAEAMAVMNRYFPLEPAIGTPGPEEGYWRSFAIAAVQKIAQDSAGAEERAILDVEPDCRRFPLTLDASPERGLDHNRIEAVERVLGDVGVLTSGEAIVAGESPFAAIPNEDVRASLDLINGGTLLRDPARVGRLRRALAVARFLSDNQDKLTFTLAAQDANDPRNVAEGTHTQCEQVKIDGKRNVLGNEGYTLFQGREVFNNYRWSLPMPDRVGFQFESTGNVQVSASLGGWGPLSGLAGESDQFMNGEVVWPLAIRLSSGRTFWMGAVFTGGESGRLDELRREWLRESDWR